MKYKTTARAVREGYTKIITIGYCDAQFLLRSRSPIAYAAGVYGWNFDVYDIGDIVPGAAICTGYRGMPAGISIDYKALMNAEDKARNGNEEKLLRELIISVLR